MVFQLTCHVVSGLHCSPNTVAECSFPLVDSQNYWADEQRIFQNQKHKKVKFLREFEDRLNEASPVGIGCLEGPGEHEMQWVFYFPSGDIFRIEFGEIELASIQHDFCRPSESLESCVILRDLIIGPSKESRSLIQFFPLNKKRREEKVSMKCKSSRCIGSPDGKLIVSVCDDSRKVAAFWLQQNTNKVIEMPDGKQGTVIDCSFGKECLTVIWKEPQGTYLAVKYTLTEALPAISTVSFDLPFDKNVIQCGGIDERLILGQNGEDLFLYNLRRRQTLRTTVQKAVLSKFHPSQVMICVLTEGLDLLFLDLGLNTIPLRTSCTPGPYFPLGSLASVRGQIRTWAWNSTGSALCIVLDRGPAVVVRLAAGALVEEFDWRPFSDPLKAISIARLEPVPKLGQRIVSSLELLQFLVREGYPISKVSSVLWNIGHVEEFQKCLTFVTDAAYAREDYTSLAGLITIAAAVFSADGECFVPFTITNLFYKYFVFAANEGYLEYALRVGMDLGSGRMQNDMGQLISPVFAGRALQGLPPVGDSHTELQSWNEAALACSLTKGGTATSRKDAMTLCNADVIALNALSSDKISDIVQVCSKATNAELLKMLESYLA